MSYLHPERYGTILRHARDSNPFYARWIPSGATPPLLTRSILQANNDELLNGHPVTARTSGSTGIPVRIHMSHARSQVETLNARFLVKHLGGPLIRTTIIHLREHEKSPLIIPIQSPVSVQLEALFQNHERHHASAVTTYPSNAVLLSQEILRQRLDLHFIQRLGLISESIDPGQIALIRRAFPQAKIWSTYSAMETGMISFQCPYEPGYHHAMTDKLGIEILDDENQPCSPGQIGRVVVTDYLNWEMPLIRYEIGDLAAFATCPCGKISQPALRQILGKVRGCLVHRDGRRIPFIELSTALRDLPSMLQYQVIQESIDDFVVLVHSAVPLDGEIKAAFKQEFGYEANIKIQPVDHIPKDPNGKFYASICRI